jgi:hypothetical protein
VDRFDVQGIAAEQSAGERIVDLRFDRARAIEGFAETDHARVGVDAHPDDVGKFLGAQRLDRRDLHGNNPPITGASRLKSHFALQHAAGRAEVLRLLVIYHNMF